MTQIPIIFIHPTPLLKSLNFAVARLLPNGRPVARGTYYLPLGIKISNKEPEWVPKTYDSQAHFPVNEWQNSLLIMHFWNKTVKRDFRCSAVKVSCLKMTSNEFKSLRKTFGIKIMSFSPVLETLSQPIKVAMPGRARDIKLNVKYCMHILLL